jgi:hypothetical protein
LVRIYISHTAKKYDKRTKLVLFLTDAEGSGEVWGGGRYGGGRRGCKTVGNEIIFLACAGN